MSRIAVLGLGPSLDLFEGGFPVTIGVNDIWARVRTDYIVCVDKPERFTPERRATIEASKPLRFYSQVKEWEQRPDFFRITLQENYPDYQCNIDLVQIPKSLCSPFVACGVGYKFHGSREIHLYGVDLIAHPNLKENQVKKIMIHFTNLRDALLLKGVKMIIHGNGALSSLNN